MRLFIVLTTMLTCIISFTTISHSQAQETAAATPDTIPHTKAEINFSFAPVVKKAAPAVVNIYTQSRVTVAAPSPFMNDPFFNQFLGQGFALGGRTREQTINSLGSGVIIKPDGMIVTSYHVVKNAEIIKVALNDKREFEAKLMIKDPGSDLAFLKITAPGPLPYLEMRNSDTLEVGDLVLAIGNPFGVGQTVTNGIVSGLARSAAGVSDYQFFIQTDAAINPGNSGGALIDMQAHLVGINTAIYSRSGGSQGIGFAIPANMVRALLDSKVQGGRVVHPWLGFSIQPVTPAIAESLGMASPQGVMVTGLSAGSPAEQSGLKSGDVILGINDTRFADERDMQYRLALTKIGDNVQFNILREGKPQMITVPLIAPPETTPRDERTLTGRNPLSGITVANLSPAVLMELNMESPLQHGVVIIGNKKAIAQLAATFTPGDIILQINGTPVTSSEMLEKLLKNGARRWQIVYQHGKNVLTLTVQM